MKSQLHNWYICAAGLVSFLACSLFGGLVSVGPSEPRLVDPVRFLLWCPCFLWLILNSCSPFSTGFPKLQPMFGYGSPY